MKGLQKSVREAFNPRNGGKCENTWLCEHLNPSVNKT